MIIDPNDFDKRSNFDECLEELTEYARAIRVEMPEITVGSFDEAYNRWSARGMYFAKDKKINVDLKRCKVATKVPGFAWSYTGYKADMTPAGVLAHEFGHYTDDIKKITRKQRAVIGQLYDAEGCVSSYCPNPSEWYAETFRLFFLNPQLLAAAKPRTWTFMLSQDLTLSQQVGWRDIMVNAHPRFITACEKFISGR